MSELIGFASPLRAPLTENVASEHTYVMSSQGDCWPCFGRSADGREICRGKGELALAQCLAGRTSTAGIRYGITGVCHQTANRILWPANLLVSEAKGYRFSSLVFHHYGLGPWSELGVCCHLLGVEHLLAERSAPGMPSSPKQPPPGLEEPEVAYVSEPNDADLFVENRLSMLTELLEAQLGPDLDRSRRNATEHITANAAREHHHLLQGVEHGRIGPEEYLRRFTGLLRHTFGELDRVLGRADFEKVFGGPPDAALGILDQDAYARAHHPQTPGKPRRP